MRSAIVNALREAAPFVVVAGTIVIVALWCFGIVERDLPIMLLALGVSVPVVAAIMVL